jgi:ADP-heptose:LPS heptosyltransferase
MKQTKKIINRAVEKFRLDLVKELMKVEESNSNTEKNPIRKLILSSPHSPGDITMMTAAIRDLHCTYPNEYLTDVESPCNEIYEGNPYITKLKKTDPEVKTIRMHYPLIHNSNEGSYHFIHGYRKFLEEQIGRPITQGDLKPDIYIREEEKTWVSAVEEIVDDRPFWIIDAGYKNDFTAKAWSFKRYQEVVDHFKNKIQFVQIGHPDHNHPQLKNVINMVGQTDPRQLIRLIYHSVGVLTPVSWPMVLAAGVPTKHNLLNRPCVVISGGREPVQWQMYPNHQFLHTCGTMRCCDNGGCWKSRVVPIGDGDNKDKDNLCLAPVKVDGQDISECMARITTEDVIKAIEKYYQQPLGVLTYDDRNTIEYNYKSRDKNNLNTYE